MEIGQAGPHRLFDDSFLRFLPAAIREPHRAWLAIPIAWALSFLGSILLSAGAQSLFPALSTPEFPMKGLMALFLLVVFAPVVETLIMAGMLVLFSRFMRGEYAILLCALLWAAFHSAQYAAWGLVIWWPFLIFSTMFMVWRQRGFMVGVAVAATTHALQNLGPGLTVAYPHLFQGAA